MSNKNLTLFRVDFGGTIGLGHLKRSLVFAKNFKKVLYISKSDKKEFISYPLITIKDEEEFFKKVQKFTPKEVVVDNYDFTVEHEKRFKKLFPDIKLSIFDDDYRDHYCDEIINHNLGAKKQKYKNPDIVKIAPPLIRDEFKKIKKRRYKKRGIFVSFGGSDAKGLSFKIAKLLKDKKLYIYTTSTNKDIKKLKRFVRVYKNIKLFIDKDVAEGMAKSKCGIITPSTIAYEAIFLKLKFIAIEVADNQIEIVKYLKKKKYRVLKVRELYKLRRFLNGKTVHKK
jgi:UDP-2,4-diacetamido-2,4,6-trideoxy-beta-L-altropyranose hydrolase